MLFLMQKLRALVARELDPWDCKDSDFEKTEEPLLSGNCIPRFERTRAFSKKLRFVIAEQL